MIKKIFWLARKEGKILVFTLTIVTVIITLFLTALFSVANVKIDLSKNFISSLDAELKGLSFEIGNVNFNKIRSNIDDNAVINAQRVGLTGSTVLIGDSGKTFKTDQISTVGGNVFVKVYSGKVIYNCESIGELLLKDNDFLLSGRWLKNEQEMVLSAYVADVLDVEIEQFVTISNVRYKVTGIYNNKSTHLIASDYNADYFLSVTETEEMDIVTIKLSSSSDTYQLYNKFKFLGFDAQLPSLYESYFENINTMEIFLIIVAIVIAMAVIVVIYCFLTMILTQRKKYICQLKMLGCSETIIMLTYSIILAAIAAVATIIATGLAHYFNRYIMSLCGSLFDMDMSISVNYYIPVVGYMCILTMIFTSYLLISNRTKLRKIAQSIKE